MQSGATFDPTGTYRYHLWREWDRSLPAVTFVMLNPSTAGAECDDPTLRRCLGFARSWGYGRLEVLNLFAYCTTSPSGLLSAADPEGPENRKWLKGLSRSRAVVAAWGNVVPRLVRQFPVGKHPPMRCLGTTALGQPRHPLYVPADQPLVPWQAPPNPRPRPRGVR
jgi:hypothetical protein